jgi:hypothetical protein
VRAWQGLQFSLTEEAKNLFEAACYCTVGKGDKVLFCSDAWLNGRSPRQVAPTLLKFVTARGAMQRYVAAVNDHSWIADIRGVPTLQEIIEFVLLWAIV